MKKQILMIGLLLVFAFSVPAVYASESPSGQNIDLGFEQTELIISDAELVFTVCTYGADINLDLQAYGSITNSFVIKGETALAKREITYLKLAGTDLYSLVNHSSTNNKLKANEVFNTGQSFKYTFKEVRIRGVDKN